jgi:hypothetical protein
MKSNQRYVAAGSLIIAATILYLLTLDNGLRPAELTGGDLITHHYAQVEGRPSNAPGYPLYTLGGWLWFRVGSLLLGWALNPIQVLSFYSTLWGLASLGMLYLILLNVTGNKATAFDQSAIAKPGIAGTSGELRKIERRRVIISLLLTAFYATTFFFWYYAVTTEQYTSAVFQTLLIIWLAFRWDESPRDSTLLWLAFMGGAMLANMVTTLFIAPPLLWFILFKPTSNGVTLLTYLKRPKIVLQAVGLAWLPLVSYAYIFVRGAQHPEWRGAGEWASTWEWFIQFVAIQQGRDELTPGLSLTTLVTGEFPALMWQELTVFAFLGGLLGLAALGRRRAIFLYGALVIYLIFSWGYRFGNWFQVIIPAYPIFIIGFAAGLGWVSNWLLVNGNWSTADKSPSRITTYHESFILLLLTILLLYRFAANLPRANQRNLPGDTGLDPGWSILADNPTLPALIVTDFSERVALEYLRAVWRVALEIKPVEAFDDSARTRVYITRRASAASGAVTQHPWAGGEQLILLHTEPQVNLPPTAQRLTAAFGDSLRLVGWETANPQAPLPAEVARRLPRANWQLALYWQASAKLEDDYTISARPLVAGQLIMEGDETYIQDHQPVWSVYPTSRWTPGEVVRDVYALTLPPGVAPDAVQIVVYKTTATGFENLAEYTFTLVEPNPDKPELEITK